MPRPHFETPKAEKDYPSCLAAPRPEEKRNVRLVGHTSLNGWGDGFQIRVRGGVCYVKRTGLYGENGITILDVSDPRKPKIIRQIGESPWGRSHKVLLVDDVLVTNTEVRAGCADPAVKPGLRLWDNSDPRNPRFVKDVVTDMPGIHRPVYDPARKLMYSGGFRDGYRGRVLLIHDFKDPLNPAYVGEAWVPGQKEGAEEPTWDPVLVGPRGCDLHEGIPHGTYVSGALRKGGICMWDLADPAKPKFLWRHNPYETHGWSPASHTFIVPPGSEFGIAVSETHTVNCAHPPAFVAFYDLRNVNVPLPVSTFQPYPIDPISMRPVDTFWCSQGSRYGSHNVWHWMKKEDLLFVTWFNAGLRILDWSNPFAPKEVGYYIPAGNKERFSPQTNEVFVDRETGLIYISDRWGLGMHILEYTG